MLPALSVSLKLPAHLKQSPGIKQGGMHGNCMNLLFYRRPAVRAQFSSGEGGGGVGIVHACACSVTQTRYRSAMLHAEV